MVVMLKSNNHNEYQDVTSTFYADQFFHNSISIQLIRIIEYTTAAIPQYRKNPQ